MYEDGNVLPTSVSNKQSTHAYMLTLGIPVIHFWTVTEFNVCNRSNEK